MATRGRGLQDFERFALGNPELLDDEVDAGRFFGDGVLDLQARVHFEERNRAIDAEQELDRAGAGVARRRADLPRGFMDRLALDVA